MINIRLSAILVLVTVVLFQTSGCAQRSTSCKCEIMLDECGRSHFFAKAPDTVKVKISENQLAKVVLNSCMGNMHFKLYDSNVLVTEGSYIDAKDTSVINTIKSDIVTGKDITVKEKIFKPRKNGSWLYYDKDGKLLKEDIYKNGSLIKSRKK